MNSKNKFFKKQKMSCLLLVDQDVRPEVIVRNYTSLCQPLFDFNSQRRAAEKECCFARSCLGTQTSACVGKVSCDTFRGIFKAIKPIKQAQPCVTSIAALHAAAKHQQLKAS